MIASIFLITNWYNCAEHVHFNGIRVPTFHCTVLNIDFREPEYVVNEDGTGGEVRFSHVTWSYFVTCPVLIQ